ncbi:MAG: tyrosine-type recombinase/integrase [Acidimicrobiales bacterium]
MATVRQRGPGVWEVRVYTGVGASGRPTQVSRTVRGTKRDALAVAASMEVEPPRSAGGRLVRDALDAWVERNRATWAPASLRDQTSRVRSIKADPVASVALARLSVGDVERWHTRLRERGLADAGVRNLHNVLRAALALAERWDWVPRNVAGLARVATTKRPPRKAMTLAEVQAVLAAAAQIGPEAALALRLAAVTGARRAELAAMRWADVVDGRLLIDSAIEVVSWGDGRPKVRDAANKTGIERTLTLDAATVEVVEQLRVERERYGPWMFTVGVDPPKPDAIGWWWRRARKLAGIDEEWRLHDLRHWSATVAIGSGHDVRTVANRLGHATPDVTLRIYAHAFAAADEALAASLGGILDG